jgi:hypothetical protein
MEKDNLKETQGGLPDARENFIREMQQTGARIVDGTVIPSSARVNEILVRGMNGGNVGNLSDANIGHTANVVQSEIMPPMADRFVRHPGLEVARDVTQGHEMSDSLQSFWQQFQDSSRHLRRDVQGGVCRVANPEAKLQSAGVDQRQGDNEMMHGNFEGARFAYFSSLQKWVDGLGARSNDIFKPDPLVSLVHSESREAQRPEELLALDGSLARLVGSATREQRGELNNLLYSFALTLDRNKPESAAILRKHILTA